MKLYKFRPLTFVPEKFVDKAGTKAPIDVYFDERIKPMLEGIFHFSKFRELNDVLEGIYLSDGKNFEEFFELKGGFGILSLSTEEALIKQLMWGHYASGYKGIAIEIELNNEFLESTHPVNYIQQLQHIDGGFSLEKVKKILTSKNCQWNDEYEVRILKEGQHNKDMPIGKVTGIYFGEPYQDLPYLKDSKFFEQYRNLKSQIIKHIIINGLHDIQCKLLTHTENGSIEFKDYSIFNLL